MITSKLFISLQRDEMAKKKNKNVYWMVNDGQKIRNNKALCYFHVSTNGSQSSLQFNGFERYIHVVLLCHVHRCMCRHIWSVCKLNISYTFSSIYYTIFIIFPSSTRNCPIYTDQQCMLFTRIVHSEEHQRRNLVQFWHGWICIEQKNKQKKYTG